MQPSQHLLSNSPSPSDAAQAIARPIRTAEQNAEDQLVGARLGVYAGLFYAMRAKHPPTASHALRVAIGCSKWCAWRGMRDEDRDLLEVAALMHDIGKIGVPDRVLQKPARLDEQELLMMDMQLAVAEEMLTAAGASSQLILIVRHARSTYRGYPTEAPAAAQMLAIVDAFDSMTTEQAFRRALSRERAFEELFTHAGTQFNPQLVRDFVELVSHPRPELEAEVANRWLCGLAPYMTPGFLELGILPSCGAIQNMLDTLFHHRLLDRLKDAAIYLDADHQILTWNRAAEQLTGRLAAAVLNHRWTADLMRLETECGQPLENCPLQHMASTHSQISVRLQIRRDNQQRSMVNFTAIPVFTGQQEFAGSIVLVRDASNEADLELRVQSLHEIATQDALTKVANRAELNRRLPELFQERAADGSPGSLIICDIDYFKRINDTFGHQAGDDALVTFAGVLRENAREGDLVARYGGEEFVILCSHCDNPAATARAEQMRRAVELTPVPSLKKNSMTASFGVTEIQSGDDPETLLARADRALLIAKKSGRNCVIQLGAGQVSPKIEEPKHAKKSGWMRWFSGAGELLISEEFLTAVPKEVAIQKLNGFISDHQAELTSVDESRVVIRVDGRCKQGVLRGGERPAIMLLDVSIQDVEVCLPGRQHAYQQRTKFVVAVTPLKARDRRSDYLRGQAQRLLSSFQAYLVAELIDDEMRQLIIEPR
jgi:diguanylate cyclase (GGDEF)-like protein